MQQLRMIDPLGGRSNQRGNFHGAEMSRSDAPTGERASGPIRRGLRVFTAGHSLHVFVADILPDLARLAGLAGHVAMGTQFLGGSRVIEHWDRPDTTNEAKRVLRSGRADVLTLSPTLHPDEGIDQFARLGLEHNPNLRITIQASWVPFDGL